MTRSPLLSLVLVAGACSPPTAPIADAGVADAGSPDAGVDDAGTPDAGVDDAGTPDAGSGDAGADDPLVDARRDILTTALDIDLATLTGTAAVTVEASPRTGASFEAKGLTITSVQRDDGGSIAWRHDAGRLDVGAGTGRQTIVVRYGFEDDRPFSQGLSSSGSTATWPYFCSYLFPCHSDPADGVVFTLNVHGNPAGTTVVFSPSTYGEAPAYQVAWATATLTEIDLGVTDAGTQVTAWLRNPGGAAQAMKNLVATVDFYERTYGPYHFGPRLGPVAVSWGFPGGLENHPFWHVDQLVIGAEDIQAHEAAHGWFGDAVRLRCWEDLVVSEGMADYLSARARAFVRDGGTATWTFPTPGGSGGVIAWPDGCGEHDPVLLLNGFVYAKGAWFLAALEARIGTAAIDRSLRRYYLGHRGGVGSMQDVIDAVKLETGYDADACARAWLKSASTPANPQICPP